MSFTDRAKQQILEMMEEFSELEFAKTPTFFFLERLRDEMRELGLEPWVTPTLGAIKLEISGLGFDYEPHEVWLSEMAKAYAKIIQKMVAAFDTFGDEVVREQLSNLSLKME